jgi:hypothetical protein
VSLHDGEKNPVVGPKPRESIVLRLDEQVEHA